MTDGGDTLTLSPFSSLLHPFGHSLTLPVASRAFILSCFSLSHTHSFCLFHSFAPSRAPFSVSISVHVFLPFLLIASCLPLFAPSFLGILLPSFLSAFCLCFSHSSFCCLNSPIVTGALPFSYAIVLQCFLLLSLSLLPVFPPSPSFPSLFSSNLYLAELPHRRPLPSQLSDTPSPTKEKTDSSQKEKSESSPCFVGMCCKSPLASQSQPLPMFPNSQVHILRALFMCARRLTSHPLVQLHRLGEFLCYHYCCNYCSTKLVCFTTT